MLPNHDPKKKESSYGKLSHSPEFYDRLLQVESSRDPAHFSNTFQNSPKTAGPLQMRRGAFDDMKSWGYYKDLKYEDLTPQLAHAGSMIYATKMEDHYGLKGENWSMLGYNQGPTKIKKLYNKHKGDLKAALNDPEMPEDGISYIKKALMTKVGDYGNKSSTLDYTKAVYNGVIKGQDINFIDPDKYIIKEAKGGETPKPKTDANWLTMPGMTKHTAGYAPIVQAGANAVGLNANDKSDVFGGAGMGALAGFLSGGPLGALLGGGSALLSYGSKLGAKENMQDEAEKSYLASRTIPGRTGMEAPPMYAALGMEVGDPNKPKTDTIRPNVANQYLFNQYKKDGKVPEYIVHDSMEGSKRELSSVEKGLQAVDDVLSAPARGMVKLATGKYEDPSTAWGYKDPQGFWQNAVNKGIDMVADPMNLLGVGAIAKIGKASKVLTKVGKAVDVVNDANKSEYVVKPSVTLAKKWFANSVNINDLRKMTPQQWDHFNKYVNVAYKNMPELNNLVTKKALALNKAGATTALINDAINIKEGKDGYDKYTPSYSNTSAPGPYANKASTPMPKKKNAATFSSDLKSKAVATKSNTSTFMPKEIEPTAITPLSNSRIPISQYNKRVNGENVPISREEYEEIRSKGKMTSTKIAQLDSTKTRIYQKKALGGYIQGNKYTMSDRDIKKLQSLGYEIEVH